MNDDKSLEKVIYVYDDDLWFFRLDKQLEIMCNWESKINLHNKKLYYINPKYFTNEKNIIKY
jgi:hypothetical protein